MDTFPLILRPHLDPLNLPRWDHTFARLWDFPLWVLITPHPQPRDFLTLRARCVASTAFKRAIQRNERPPSIPIPLCPSDSAPFFPQPPASAPDPTAPHSLILQPVDLTLFSFEFWGPCGTCAQSFYAGACPACNSVHWQPHRILSAPWNAADYAGEGKRGSPLWVTTNNKGPARG